MTLWHFTCAHAHRLIGPRGLLMPNEHVLMPELGPVVWLTDNPTPQRDDIGLTSVRLKCDRMAYRYKIAATDGVVPWRDVRGDIRPDLLADLESYAQPDTWWLAREPIPARLA